MNDFLHVCYTARDIVFLHEREATAALGYLGAFIRNYAQAALLSHQQGQYFWNLTPKFHYLLHVEHDMRQHMNTGCKHIFNPVLYSTAMAEDSVGRLSMMTRTVHPSNVSQRTAQKYLLDVKARWDGTRKLARREKKAAQIRAAAV